MILVLLGTNPYPFNRLLLAIDNWAAATGEKVIAQIGHTQTPVSHLECHDFVPHDQIMSWLEKADVVVSQGGFGSLRDCIRAGKPIIAVPRIPELGECQDEQSELVEMLAKEGRVIYLNDIADLPITIERAKTIKQLLIEESRIPSLVAHKVNAVLADI